MSPPPACAARRCFRHDVFHSNHVPVVVPDAQRAPAPRRGEGRGEGVRKFEKIPRRPNPLTLASLRSLDLSPAGRGDQKIGGRPAGFPPSALQCISQPVSRVLDGMRIVTPAHVTAIPLGRRLPGASSNQPGRQDPDTDPGAASSAAPPLFGLAPGGVCRAAGVAAGAVRSYRTVSPLLQLKTQRAAAVCSLWHFPWARARRMLSGTVGPWSPDFPPGFPSGRPAD